MTTKWRIGHRGNKDGLGYLDIIAPLERCKKPLSLNMKQKLKDAVQNSVV